LSAAYVEKSKFEQLIEQGRIRETEARAALEQAQLDEVAINRAGGPGRCARRERFGQGDTHTGCLMDRIGAWTAFQLLGDASRRVMRIGQLCRRRGHRYLEQLAKRHRTPSARAELIHETPLRAQGPDMRRTRRPSVWSSA